MMSVTLAEDLMLAGDSFGAVVTGMSGGRFRENVFWRVKQRVLQRVAVYCSMVQCVAAYYSALHCVKLCCIAL